MKKMKRAALPISRAKTAYGLLTEVRKLIVAEPKRYWQGTYIERHSALTGEIDPTDLPSCGTVGCVAGWVATLKRGRDFTYGETNQIARDILGIGSMQAGELFDGGVVDGDQQTRAHARAGARHIAAFQKRYAEQFKATKV